MGKATILVLGGDDALREALATSIAACGGDVQQVRDAREGQARLVGALALPGAILLEPDFPRLDGQGFLRWLRSEPRLAHIPVVTTSDEGAAAPWPPPPAVLPDVEELARLLVSLCEG